MTTEPKPAAPAATQTAPATTPAAAPESAPAPAATTPATTTPAATPAALTFAQSVIARRGGADVAKVTLTQAGIEYVYRQGEEKHVLQFEGERAAALRQILTAATEHPSLIDELLGLHDAGQLHDLVATCREAGVVA